MIDIVIKWAIPAILTAIFGFIAKELKDNRNTNKAMKSSMLSLIRSQITSKVENYLNLGYLPEYARYCLSDLMEQYRALGGNHGVEKLVEQCFELPPTKKEG